jgi:23S rRNA (uridine2552-2'-O)-methyltransferase
MAPDTTGIAFTDQARSVELFLRALDLAQQLSAPSSSFVAKIFMGDGFDQALRGVKALYAHIKTTRPDATRKQSTEVYVVAQGKKSGPH